MGAGSVHLGTVGFKGALFILQVIQYGGVKETELDSSQSCTEE